MNFLGNDKNPLITQIDQDFEEQNSKDEKQSGLEQVQQIRNQIKIVEKQLEEIQEENDYILNHTRENEAIILSKDNDDQLNQMRSQIEHLRKTYAERRKDIQKLDKEKLVQQEYLVRLEQQHRQICVSAGIPFSLNQTRADEMKDLMAKNFNQQIEKKRKEEESKKKYNMTIQNMQKMYEQIQELYKSKNTDQFEHEKIVNQLSADYLQEQIKKKTLDDKLKELNQEWKIMQSQTNKYKRQVRYNQLQPLEKVEGVISNQSQINLSAVNKQSGGSNKKDNIIEIIKEQQGASQLSKKVKLWDDSELLPQNKDYELTWIEFGTMDNYIVSIQCGYIDAEKNIIDIETGFGLQNKKKEQEEEQDEKLQVQQGEKLKQSQTNKEKKDSSVKYHKYNITLNETITKFEGQFSERHGISYIEINTNRENTFILGTRDVKQKDFALIIPKDKKVISLNGAIDTRNYIKLEDKSFLNFEFLFRIGVELKKRNIHFKEITKISQANLSSVVEEKESQVIIKPEEKQITQQDKNKSDDESESEDGEEDEKDKEKKQNKSPQKKETQLKEIDSATSKNTNNSQKKIVNDTKNPRQSRLSIKQPVENNNKNTNQNPNNENQEENLQNAESEPNIEKKGKGKKPAPKKK